MNEAWLPWVGFGSASLFTGAVCLLVRRWVQMTRAGEASLQPPRVTLQLAEDNIAQTGSFDLAFARLIDESGYPIGPTVGVILLIGCGLLAAAALFVAFENVLVSLLGLVAMLAALVLVTVWLRARRWNQILENLPSSVDMLARSVRAGESLEQAFRTTAEKARGPLAADLRRCVRQIEMGLPFPAALRRLEQRNRLLDVQMLVGALVVHRQTGGNLPVTLERLAMVVRERLAYRRQLQSMTASARLAALIISAAAPCLLVYFLFNKSLGENLFDDPRGQSFLLLAAVLEIVGIVWLMALSRSEI